MGYDPGRTLSAATGKFKHPRQWTCENRVNNFRVRFAILSLASDADDTSPTARLGPAKYGSNSTVVPIFMVPVPASPFVSPQQAPGMPLPGYIMLCRLALPVKPTKAS